MARVIRGSGSVVPKEIVDAREEAERIVTDARKEAERIVTEARRAAQDLESEAKSAGLRAADAEAATLLVTAAGLRDGALSDAERAITELGLAAARHIVTEQLTLSPERAQTIVRDVLGRARRAKRVTVRIHPQDADEVAMAFPGVEVVADPDVLRGGCVVTTDLGQLDARLEVRLEALRKSLGF